MTPNPSQVLDSFDGLSDKEPILRFALDSDYPFVHSLVCDPSTVAALNDTPESAQATLGKIWAQGLKPTGMRHIIAMSQDQGDRIGYLRLLYPFDFDRCLWMSFLGVVPERRGKGFGRRILELLFVGVKKNPLILKFGMHTVRTNVHAVALYESLGFECVRREPCENEDGTRDERLTLVRDLAER